MSGRKCREGRKGTPPRKNEKGGAGRKKEDKTASRALLVWEGGGEERWGDAFGSYFYVRF